MKVEKSPNLYQRKHEQNEIEKAVHSKNEFANILNKAIERSNKDGSKTIENSNNNEANHSNTSEDGTACWCYHYNKIPVMKANVPNSNGTVISAPVLKKSVTELTKEERLSDIKGAVNKVKAAISENKTTVSTDKTKVVGEKDTNTKSKTTKIGRSKKTDSMIEADKEPIIREDPTTKVIVTPTNTYTINLLEYKDDEDRLRAFMKTIPENVLIANFETDELKTQAMLWEEGKTIHDPKLGEYVIAVNVWEDGIYKIFAKDIIHVIAHTYYDDVRLANPKNLGSYYQVYHRGRRVFDKINKKAFDHLTAGGFIPETFVCTVDAHTRLRFFNKRIGDITDDVYKHEMEMRIPVNLRSRMSSQTFYDDEAVEEGVDF